MRVLLIRHGRSTWNVESRWQGRADPPLSADGEKQVEAVAAALRDLPIRIVVSSDLTRATSTAEIIARVVGVGVSVEPALRERDIGLWTGMTSEEIEAAWPGQLAIYRADPKLPVPEGEGAEALMGRAMPALLTLPDGIRMTEWRSWSRMAASSGACGWRSRPRTGPSVG